jgi:cytochrome c oxidase subunit 4
MNDNRELEQEFHSHVTSLRTYTVVWICLLILTFVTTEVAEIDLGEWNVVVALIIAATKMSLVGIFFMHVKGSSHLTKLIVAAGLFWMAILFALTLGDYFSRSWLPRGGWF